MKYIKNYRAVALLLMLICVGFFVSPGTEPYGLLFGVVNFFGAGVLFTASLLAYISPKGWLLTTIVTTMIFLIIFNAVWFSSYGVFLSTGFPLIGYDLMVVVVNLHYLGIGVDVNES